MSIAGNRDLVPELNFRGLFAGRRYRRSMAADLTKLASQLVRDLKTAFWLPPYDTANVSKVIEQMVELHDRAKAEQEVPSFDSQDPRDTCAPMVLLLAMIRNRDLLVSYLRCAAAAQLLPRNSVIAAPHNSTGTRAGTARSRLSSGGGTRRAR